MLYFRIFWKNYGKTQRTCHSGPSPGKDLKLEHQACHSHHNTDLIILHTTNAEEKVVNMKLKNQTNLSQVQFLDASEFLQKMFVPQDQILCLCADTTSTDNQVVYHPKTIKIKIMSHTINITVVPNGCETWYLL
jgi:hypothetical protein